MADQSLKGWVSFNETATMVAEGNVRARNMWLHIPKDALDYNKSGGVQNAYQEALYGLTRSGRF